MAQGIPHSMAIAVNGGSTSGRLKHQRIFHILALCELPVNFRLLPLILKTVIHNQGSCALSRLLRRHHAAKHAPGLQLASIGS